ncbi:hypothetical protein N431DRAFT_502684 [Stipitochalara longipes BDJ]|nr:hypothetical protein N431DRAFT_502684 [Stipitochalara longipes BDJ]
MSAQQSPDTQSYQALLHIIINDPSLTDELIDTHLKMQKHTVATITIFTNMTKQGLLTRLRSIFDLGLFGIHDRVPNSEVASAEFSIRWLADDKLPEMWLKELVDFGRGLALMEARGWKDPLVAYCDLKEATNKNRWQTAQTNKGKKSGALVGVKDDWRRDVSGRQ